MKGLHQQGQEVVPEKVVALAAAVQCTIDQFPVVILSILPSFVSA